MSHRSILVLTPVLIAPILLVACGRVSETQTEMLGPVDSATWDKEITNSIGMHFVRIPSGKFQMGSPENEEGRYSEEDLHPVEITRDFWMGIYEVTQGQYEKIMKTNPSTHSAKGEFKDKVKGMDTTDFPVERVSSFEAIQFLDRLSALPEERRAGRLYRLPTEAEWEYACRGGEASHQAFNFGNVRSTCYANLAFTLSDDQKTSLPSLGRTCKVGSYKPNGFGLYDMHGNVDEWCSDWYEKDYYQKSPLRDPTGPSEKADGRVCRGACFVEGMGRTAQRRWSLAEYGTFHIGLRAVLVPRQ